MYTERKTFTSSDEPGLDGILCVLLKHKFLYIYLFYLLFSYILLFLHHVFYVCFIFDFLVISIPRSNVLRRK
mgnify:CR=1 FL=1